MKRETLEMTDPNTERPLRPYVEIHGQHSDDYGMLVECWRWYLPDFSEVIFFVEARDVCIHDA